ncbi:MAG: TolC family protein [Gemmatimonadales bacterium]
MIMSQLGRSAALVLLVWSAAADAVAAQDSLTLERAVAIAQERGFPARAAQATRDAARFRDRAFYGRLLPQLSLSGTLPRYNRSIIQVVQPDGSTLFRPQDLTNSALTATVTQRLPLTGGDLFVTSSLSRLAVTGQQTTRTYSSTPFSIGLRQDLFRPNTDGWDRREQPVRSELAERGYREAKEDIALQTSSLFFDVYAAKMALDNAARNVGVNDTLYRLNQGRFEVGRIGENDLLQSELALLRSRNALDGARLEYDRNQAALRTALDLPADAPMNVMVPTTVPTVTIDTLLASSEAMRNRASVTDAELQRIQADRRVTEAKLANGFGATVQASYGFNATAPEMNLAYSNLLEARQFSLSVEVPLVRWGAHKGEVQAAQAERTRTESQAALTLRQTANEGHFAALELAQAARALTISAKADTVATKRFEVAYNRYVIGRITIDNLYLAQSEKDQAVVQFVQAMRGYWQAYYRLRRLTLYDFVANRPID